MRQELRQPDDVSGYVKLQIGARKVDRFVRLEGCFLLIYHKHATSDKPLRTEREIVVNAVKPSLKPLEFIITGTDKTDVILIFKEKKEFDRFFELALIAEQRRFEKNYVMGERIGEGAYAVVKMCYPRYVMATMEQSRNGSRMGSSTSLGYNAVDDASQHIFFEQSAEKMVGDGVLRAESNVMTVLENSDSSRLDSSGKLEYGPDNCYAVKLVHKHKVKHAEDLQLIRREVGVHRALAHDKIVKLFDVYEDSRYIYLVLEYMQLDLWDLQEDIPTFREREAQVIMYCILEGLEHCHRIGVVHRDVKPENIFCTAKSWPCYVKLADFGLSRFYDPALDPAMTSFVGTNEYVAPEVIQELPYDFGCDLWSAGCVMYELITGRKPFWGETEKDLLAAVMKGVPYYHERVEALSKEGRSILRGLMQKDQTKRLTAEAALRHPWFDSLRQADNYYWTRLLDKPPPEEQPLPLSLRSIFRAGVFAVAFMFALLRKAGIKAVPRSGSGFAVKVASTGPKKVEAESLRSKIAAMRSSNFARSGSYNESSTNSSALKEMEGTGPTNIAAAAVVSPPGGGSGPGAAPEGSKRSSWIANYNIKRLSMVDKLEGGNRRGAIPKSSSSKNLAVDVGVQSSDHKEPESAPGPIKSPLQMMIRNSSEKNLSKLQNPMSKKSSSQLDLSAINAAAGPTMQSTTPNAGTPKKSALAFSLNRGDLKSPKKSNLTINTETAPGIHYPPAQPVSSSRLATSPRKFKPFAPGGQSTPLSGAGGGFMQTAAGSASPNAANEAVSNNIFQNISKIFQGKRDKTKRRPVHKSQSLLNLNALIDE
mmetsp:Transcript_6949/g.12523  ORF Transcript_6949/g.12523 Transcript_6949/m.12523 type:complete len:820 (+) Transcript_6949:213-2672(+)